MNTRELALLLRTLVSAYRERNGGKRPGQIYASADIFSFLEAEKSAPPLRKAQSGYMFEGVAIEPKLAQALPFVLRP
jgi:hypothetical protein